MVDGLQSHGGDIRDAVLKSGVSEETLDDYIEKASDSVKYYDFDSLKTNYGDKFGYSKPEDVIEIQVLKKKYLAPHEMGPLYLWDRLAASLASVEAKEKQDHWYNEFMSILRDFKFVPGGRVMHGAGRTDVKRHPTLSNCYVIPIEEDSLEGIYKCITESAMVYRTGGGVGTDLSILRPEGSPVNATIDHSPGATAFMNLFSESTNTVSQAGRRGALMLTLRVDHPDIEKFITTKNDPKRLKVAHANISVLLTHEFMDSVINDKNFDLRWGGKTYKIVKAKDLWYSIIKNAHASAEPGLIFWDTMKDYHNLEYVNPLSSTNPCGEQPLAAYTACNLGNINLSALVNEDKSFGYNGLEKVVRSSVRFMDNIIDYNINNHASEKIKKAVASDRRIGLGVTGLGDMFVKMGVKYDTQEAIDVAEKIFRTIRDIAYKTSIEIAKEKGAFPLFEWEGYSKSKFVQSLPQEIQEDIKKYGIRNGTIITVPPVGTGSIVARTSSGIEPIFAKTYKREVKRHDGEGSDEYDVVTPIFRELFLGIENLPDYAITAHDIDPYFRVKMQGVIQKYVDSSISSTVNLAEDVSVETVANLYMNAYKMGLKGITVYREGSRKGILKTEEFTKRSEDGSLENRVNGNGLHPEPRKRVYFGITERIKTGEGSLYVTINSDVDGKPRELFTTIGKAGGNAAAQSEAISRLASLALRSGVSAREIVKQLKGISGPASVYDPDHPGEKILSTPDAMGKALERYIDGDYNNPITFVKNVENNPKHSENKKNENRETTSCPECGVNVGYVSSCVICHNCGWSKC